jgi:undecaprenyl diphosphate synthase
MNSKLEQKKLGQKLLKKINVNELPNHIAIIMDGNGRWAKMRNLPRTFGHRQGIKSVREVIEGCTELGIKILTLYAFSTENWQRPKTEIRFLMRLLYNYLKREAEELHKKNIKLTTIGDITKLPENVQSEIEHIKNVTKNNSGLILNLALNYGGRSEIIESIKKLVKSKKEINEQNLSEFMYTSGLPDPDLLIRTSGELRISNFLLWQIAYTELYFTDVLWPDFRKEDLYKAIIDYQSRDRRFGRV